MASPAAIERDNALFVIGISAAIFVVVASLVIYAIVKYRVRGKPDGAEPTQVYGSLELELAWTVIPILIVFIIMGVSSRIVFSVENASQPPETTHLTLIGHQWWWEIRYPGSNVVTANEIHVPIGDKSAKRATYLDLRSADVIHSFWVPQLAGKVDLIPNRANQIWIDPRQAGIYLGNCAEYCGTQHAKMLLRVFAEPKQDFENWLAAQSKPAVKDPAVVQDRAVFESLACVNCHFIEGTIAHGRFGPDLTHLMSRTTIASGVLPLDEKNLRAWVDDPQQIKSGCLMPSFKLDKPELDHVVAYLLTLH